MGSGRLFGWVLRSAVLWGAAMGLAGCDRDQAAIPEPPPATVTVAHPVRHNVMEWDEFTGRLEAVEFVEVRARVGGLIVAAPFEEGALVEAGDLLFEIDARPFEAELSGRLAAQAEAAAQLEFSQIEYNRLEAIPASARSSTELDRASATLERAAALLDAARAAVELARLNVEWCQVKAPISGRVSERMVTPGNLISGGTGQSTLLTTITSVDPIYCYVDADERSVLKYTDLARKGRRVSARNAQIPCVMQLADETGFPHRGVVDFVDNRANPETGTIRGRGAFPNPDGAMLPGFFARVRVPGSGRYDAVLVPDAAVTTDLNQKTLWVVDEGDVVRARPVVLGALFGDLRAVESGISETDRVIINGLMHARPGAPVKPVAGSISLDSLPPFMDLIDWPAATQPAATTQEVSR